VNPWPIAPLTPADLDFAPVNYDFTGFTASELGGTDAILAAIDADLADAMASVADQQTLGAAMDGDLADMMEVLREIDVTQFESIFAEIWAAADATDSGFDKLATLVG
jgi:hypothetical protein